MGENHGPLVRGRKAARVEASDGDVKLYTRRLGAISAAPGSELRLALPLDLRSTVTAGRRRPMSPSRSLTQALEKGYSQHQLALDRKRHLKRIESGTARWKNAPACSG